MTNLDKRFFNIVRPYKKHKQRALSRDVLEFSNFHTQKNV